MKKAKVFRKIREKNRILGLEIPDFLFLGMIYLVIFLVSKNLLLNFALIGASYFFLRLYKKGKPRHWTNSLIRFLFAPRIYRIKGEARKEIIR